MKPEGSAGSSSSDKIQLSQTELTDGISSQEPKIKSEIDSHGPADSSWSLPPRPAQRIPPPVPPKPKRK